MLNKTKLIAVIGVLIASTGLAACAPGSSGGTGSSGQKVIGLLAPETTDNSYSSAYVKAAQEEAKKHGVELKIYNAQYSASTQASQADELFAQKPDAVVLWPADSTAVTPIVTKAKAMGIPLSISNSEVAPAVLEQVGYYTGPSNSKEGEAAAKLMVEALGANPSGDVAVVGGIAGNATAVDRFEGFKSAIAQLAPDVHIVAVQNADWDKAKAISVTAAILNQHGKTLKAIYAEDDTMAAGASQALQSAGYAPGQIKLVGIGFSTAGAENIKGGYQYGTVLQSPVLDGQYAVKYMADFLAGNKPAQKQNFIPIPPVTAKNINDNKPEW